MGVAIVDKDVSLISSVNSIATTSIDNIGGVTGWAGNSGVRPIPTPNWPNVSDPISSGGTPSSARITGITQPITLNIYFTSPSINSVLYVLRNTVNVWTRGGILLTTSPSTITVNPDDYVLFQLSVVEGGTTDSVSIDVYNASDGNRFLDSFTLSRG